MTLTKAHLDFEKQFDEIKGLKLSKVEYLEVNYGEYSSGPFYLTKFQDLDSLDFSIILYFEEDVKAELFWDGQFFQYGVGLKINQDPVFSNFKKWDVSQSKLWQKFIGDTIEEVDTQWSWVTTTELDEDVDFDKDWVPVHDNNEELIHYPQSIRIKFSSDRTVIISASELVGENEDKADPLSNNLLVTDNEVLAKEIGMID